MAIERTYNVPLRKEYQKAPKYRRAKKAVIALRAFIAKHMKVEGSSVKLGQHLNNTVWVRGIKSPPHHVKITVTKGDDGIVKAELFGFSYENKKTADTEKPAKESKETHVHADGEEHDHAHDHDHPEQVKKAAPKKEAKAPAEKKPVKAKKE